MKRIAMVVVVLLASAGFVFASGMSVVTGGGYGLGMDRETFGVEIEDDAYSNYFVGPGSGPRGLGGVEFGLGDHFSAALSGGYVENIPEQHVHWTMTSDTWMTTSFVPAFMTFRGYVPVGPVSFFGGAGPSAGFLALSTVNDFVRVTGTEYDWTIESTYTTGWGYHGVLGAQVDIGKWLSVRLEFRGEQLTFRPKQAVITAYTIDGEDHLTDAYPDVNDRETLYVQDIHEYLNDPVDPDAPRQELAFNISADTVGVFLGVVVHVY